MNQSISPTTQGILAGLVTCVAVLGIGLYMYVVQAKVAEVPVKTTNYPITSLEREFGVGGVFDKTAELHAPGSTAPLLNATPLPLPTVTSDQLGKNDIAVIE